MALEVWNFFSATKTIFPFKSHEVKVVISLDLNLAETDESFLVMDCLDRGLLGTDLLGTLAVCMQVLDSFKYSPAIF